MFDNNVARHDTCLILKIDLRKGKKKERFFILSEPFAHWAFFKKKKRTDFLRIL